MNHSNVKAITRIYLRIPETQIYMRKELNPNQLAYCTFLLTHIVVTGVVLDYIFCSDHFNCSI